MSLPQTQIISSPATSSIPLSELPQFKEGQEIAFILNRTDVIPGFIVHVNPDDTYDLECEVPQHVRKIRWKGKPGQSEFSVSPALELQARPFLRALPTDPRIQVSKVIQSLESLGIPLPGKESVIQQSAIHGWKDTGKRTRIPRLTEFFAPLVGHFFDPSLFYYKITCWRAAINIRGEGTIPEETRLFPNPTKTPPYYTSFRKCFSRYVKEYLGNLEKWNRVEISAILPEDVLPKSKAANIQNQEEED